MEQSQWPGSYPLDGRSAAPAGGPAAVAGATTSALGRRMRNRLHWVVLLAIILVCGIVVLRHDEELWNRLTEQDVASLTTWGLWAAVVGASVVVMFRNQLF